MTYDRCLKFLAVATICFVLGACASRPPATSTSKGKSTQTRPAVTIIVPDEQTALAQDIRRSLAERGWNLIAYSNDTTDGNADYRQMAQQARYRLTLLGTPVGRCRNGEPSFLYRIAIIENGNSTVPLAMSGADCLTPIMQEFSTQLDQKQFAPSRSATAKTVGRRPTSSD